MLKMMAFIESYRGHVSLQFQRSFKNKSYKEDMFEWEYMQTTKFMGS